MTQQQIEQAARKYGCDAYIEYCRQHGVDAATAKYPSLENAFITGAEWMLQNMWISVDEELPTIDEETKASEYVLATNGTWKDCLRYTKQETWIDYANYSHWGITHWMKIPPLEGGEK